ncbi:MAG: AraC family transcriptional regulator [Halioglobus sp.]
MPLPDYLVRASALEGFDRLVQELGGDPSALRRAAGIAPGAIPYDSWISYSAFLTLLENSARTLECPHFGLSLSRYQDIGILGSVGFVMRESPDVATALGELSRYFTLHNQGGEVHLAQQGATASLSFEPKMPGSIRTTQQIDLILGMGLKIMRLLCGAQWCPTTVYVTHQEPADRAPLRKLLDCPIVFNAEMCMFTFPQSTLAQKISNADSDLHRVLAQHLSTIRQRFPDSYPDQIRYLIRQALLTGDCSIERVAGYLSITKRTLQRRLRAEGTSYKALLEEVRFNVASRYLLESDASLTSLADMLGYSELSAFSNAFKNQTGLSPRRWRAQRAH